jgi:hypothetical protein
VSKRIAGILGIQVGDGAVHANLRTSSF